MSQHKNIKAICAFHSQQVYFFLFNSEWLKKEFELNVSLQNFQSWDWIVMDINMQIVQH
jgi:hypothetical protein